MRLSELATQELFTAALRAPSRSPRPHFGGPDRPPGLLRDLLESRVDAVPPGGAIDWMTYYFCDERLAASLVRAHRRGVAVRLCLEGSPRHSGANDAVIARLAHPRDGIGDGLRIMRHLLATNLHAKAYCFSGPRPMVLIGSFNPSGNDAENPQLTADIGDHDRGHNLLVELEDASIIAALRSRIDCLFAGLGSLDLAARPELARFRGESCEGLLFPYFRRNPLTVRLERLRSGSSLRVAASHIRDPGFARLLSRLAARGVATSVISHHTKRRLPRAIERILAGSDVKLYRYRHPDGLPMHCKFLLVEEPEQRWCSFGSYNFTRTSRWLNHESLLFSSDEPFWWGLDGRWRDILCEPCCQPVIS